MACNMWDIMEIDVMKNVVHLHNLMFYISSPRILEFRFELF